jgi:uncharacterized Rmd1/YagE family protein
LAKPLSAAVPTIHYREDIVLSATSEHAASPGGPGPPRDVLPFEPNTRLPMTLREQEGDMADRGFSVRALQLGERIDLKGLERDDAFSTNPLGFPTVSGGTVVLFKFGAAVFFALTPVEEEDLISSLGYRIGEPLKERESETARIVVRGDSDDLVSSSGAIQLQSAEPNRLLLVAEAMAVSVALAFDERRIAGAFERIEPIAKRLAERQLPAGPRAALLEQIGEALLAQQRLADRVDLDEKPDVLWDHPELERFWAKLVDEYDLPQRGRAISRKLEVIRETADTITDLISTRTSHRLEWYIIGLIMFEIGLGLYDRFWR